MSGTRERFRKEFDGQNNHHMHSFLLLLEYTITVDYNCDI